MNAPDQLVLMSIDKEERAERALRKTPGIPNPPDELITGIWMMIRQFVVEQHNKTMSHERVADPTQIDRETRIDETPGDRIRMEERAWRSIPYGVCAQVAEEFAMSNGLEDKEVLKQVAEYGKQVGALLIEIELASLRKEREHLKKPA